MAKNKYNKNKRKNIVLEIEDNIQWHPAFCSAIELELREYLKYEREHNLSKMPLKNKEILDTSITVSLVRKQKPVKLLEQLKEKYKYIKSPRENRFPAHPPVLKAPL